MTIMEARQLVGHICSVSWLDSRGRERSIVARITGVGCVPAASTFVLMASTDIRLDRITAVFLVDENGSQRSYYSAGPLRQQAA